VNSNWKAECQLTCNCQLVALGYYINKLAYLKNMADFGRDIANSDSDDERFMNLAAQGRRPKNVRPRIENFNVWNDDEFFVRFRLTKATVLHLLQQIEHNLETATDRFA
jgi:hypothetical protein